MAIDHKQVTQLEKLALNIQLDILISVNKEEKNQWIVLFL